MGEINDSYGWQQDPMQVHWLEVQHSPDCQLVTAAGRRQLWSSDALTCVIQRTCTRPVDRSLAVAGPCLWYSLPAERCHPNISLREFRRALKTHLFLNWVRRLVTLAFSAPYKCSYLLIYLLTYTKHRAMADPSYHNVG